MKGGLEISNPSSKELKIMEDNLKIVKLAKDQVFTENDVLSLQPLVRGEDGEFVRGEVQNDDAGYDDEKLNKSRRFNKFKKLKKEVKTHFEDHREMLFRNYDEMKLAQK